MGGHDIDYEKRLRTVARGITSLLIPAVVLVLLGFINIRLAQAGVILGGVAVIALVFVPAILVLYWHFSTFGNRSTSASDAENRSHGGDEDGAGVSDQK